jgi:hypothetical protein
MLSPYFFGPLSLVLCLASHFKDDGTFFYGRQGLALLMFTATDTQQLAFAFTFINVLSICGLFALAIGLGSIYGNQR